MEEEAREVTTLRLIDKGIQAGLTFLKGFFTSQKLEGAAVAVDRYRIKWYPNRESLVAAIKQELSTRGRSLPPGALGMVIDNTLHCSLGVGEIIQEEPRLLPYLKEMFGIHEPTHVVINSLRKKAGITEALNPLLSEGVAFWLGAKESGVDPLLQAQKFVTSGDSLPSPDHKYLLETHPTKGLYFFDPMKKQRCLVTERTHKGYLVVASFFGLMTKEFGFPRCWQLCLTTNKEQFRDDFKAILGVPFEEMVKKWKTIVYSSKPS